MATFADNDTLALYRLDDRLTTINYVQDDTGRFDFTSSSTVAPALGKVDGCYYFNGSQVVVAPNLTQFDPMRAAFRTGVFTAEAWVKMDASPPASEQVPFAIGSSSTGSTANELFRFGFTTTRVLYMGWQNGAKVDNSIVEPSGTVWDVSVWYRLGISVNLPAGTVSFWRNGVKLGERTGAALALPDGGEVAQVVFGRRSIAASGFLKGWLDHLHFSTVAYGDVAMAARAESNLHSTAPGGVTPRLQGGSGLAAQRRVFVPGSLRLLGPEAAKDADPPVISGMTPAPGTGITRQTPITFRVTDPVKMGRVIVAASFSPGGATEIVHDGNAFSPLYTGGMNYRIPTTGGGDGWDYRILRTGGWPSAPELRVYAVDGSGLEAA